MSTFLSFKAAAVTLLSVHLVVLVSCFATENFPETAAYGSKVPFRADQALHFPDFEVTYMGKRHVTPPQYPRGWWVHDFKVRSNGNEQTVSWSVGTGDIGPVRFKVNGAEFQIELSLSDKLGHLREGEMVISPVPASDSVGLHPLAPSAFSAGSEEPSASWRWG
jgi:hypothetical protein